MSEQHFTILIEGLPYCLGNFKPSWYSGTLDDGLVEWPRVNQHIDLMGGVARFDDVSFEVLDPLTRWAPMFRPVQPTVWRASAPNPIEYNTTTITMDDATGIAVGHVLYAENDTWTVTDISAAPDIVVTRQTYSCLSAGWACRYQADITRDYVTEVSRTGPPIIMGRMMAIYIDGALEYIGRIVDLTQQGRAWNVRTTSVLNCLTEAIQPPNVGIRLRNAWNYNAGRWGAGGQAHVLTGDATRGGSIETMLTDFAVYATSITQNSVAYGWMWVGDDTRPLSEPGEIQEGGLFYGCVQSMGSEWQYVELIGYVTRPLGVSQYGVVYTYVGGADYLLASDIHISNGVYDLDGFVGSYVKCGDQLLRVSSVTEATGAVYFDRIVDAESAVVNKYLSAGYDSRAPIELTVAPIIACDSIPSAVHEVITGTGALGLGLPAALYGDAPAVPQGSSSPVWWDWSVGGIDEDLRAHGLALVLRDGVLNMIQVIPPIEAAATEDIAQTDLTGKDVPEIARGYEAPVAAITFSDDQNDYTCAWTSTTGPGRAALRTLKFSTQIKGVMTDADAWMRLQAARLQWLAAGVPTMTIGLLADTLQVGQVITLDSRYVSNGNYKTETIPALVVGRDPAAAEYQIALNLIPSAGAVWAFSIEVSSAALAVITPVLQSDLATFAALVPVGTEVMLTENDGTSSIWTGTIASYQATTVTLSSAPTIDADEIAILTCEVDNVTWGALQERQVYAADASGEIPDPGDPAKVLT